MDIIEKLRSPFPTLTGLAKDGMEAADEIERLRGAIDYWQMRCAELKEKLTEEIRISNERGAFIENKLADMAALSTENAELLARYRWLERLFDRKWNGVIDSGCKYSWSPIGPWRHEISKLSGETLWDAIGNELNKEKE